MKTQQCPVHVGAALQAALGIPSSAAVKQAATLTEIGDLLTIIRTMLLRRQIREVPFSNCVYGLRARLRP